jgi:hypothetical protein
VPAALTHLFSLLQKLCKEQFLQQRKNTASAAGVIMRETSTIERKMGLRQCFRQREKFDSFLAIFSVSPS